MNSLPDINVWIALAFPARKEHMIAKAWFAGCRARSCFFCRLSQQGFLRLSTNPQVMKSDVLSMSQAWQEYDALMLDPRIGFADEPPGLEYEWRRLTMLFQFSNKVWSDAFLAGMAIELNLELITFDAGFRNFPGLNCTIL
jgi:toxin-antitoxin system PIN domain toxin